jgi:quercetin dioxygenase-like cupin family protein
MLTPLRLQDGKGAFVMKFKAGSRCPAHSHPGGEEIYLIESSGRLDDLPIAAGDFIYTTPGDRHVRTQIPTSQFMLCFPSLS